MADRLRLNGDVPLQIGNVTLIIPKNTDVDSLMNDARMFADTAERVLDELVNTETNCRVSCHVGALYGVLYFLQLSKEMGAAAHTAVNRRGDIN